MANLMNDDRVPELLAKLLIKQDRHEGLLTKLVELIEKQGQSIDRTNELVSTLTEVVVKQGGKLDRHTELLESISIRLTDNGTHEVRIMDLERSGCLESGRGQLNPFRRQLAASQSHQSRQSPLPNPNPKASDLNSTLSYLITLN